MLGNRLQKLWLPYLFTVTGIFFSLLIWYIVWHPSTITLLINLTLLFGFSFVAIILVLHRMNANLKNEISERISAEESKQKLEVALLQGQKLQAIGTLAGGIAHDFNNILYAITGYVEMAREDVVKDSIEYKNLGQVIEAAHKGQELISRILSFSRHQHHDFQHIILKKNLEAVLALLRPTIPASVILNFKLETDASIFGNQTQIHQVLVNLINNAVDAMDGEGHIDIHLSLIPADDALLKALPEALPQKYCKLVITDTGHGMDQPTMERIYEPFFTTKEVGKGTGLGLSIVHSIIHEHHGDITVRSQIGKGTTFIILLPEYARTGSKHGQNLTG